METEGYATPEDAARGDIPARYTIVIATALSPAGDRAVVVLDTDGHVIDSLCRQVGDRWFELQSGSAGDVGFTSIGSDRGVLRLVAEAPPTAVAAIVRHQAEDHRVPVQNGHVLFVAWDDPYVSEPRLMQFLLADGSEIVIPSWIGSADGPEDLGLNAERYLRELYGG